MSDTKEDKPEKRRPLREKVKEREAYLKKHGFKEASKEEMDYALMMLDVIDW